MVKFKKVHENQEGTRL